VAIVAAIVVVQALLMLWFAWPAQRIGPRDVPIVVAGPAPATSAFADRIASERAGAFDITIVADAATADELLRDREAYGAFIVGADGVSVHIATAASPTVAAALTQAASPQATVVEVVPPGKDDPRGAGFASAFLPLLLTSIITGAVVAMLIASTRTRLAVLLGYGLAAGLLAGGVMQWAGLVGGSYLFVAGAIALLTLAVSAAVAGQAAVLGPAGIALGAFLFFVFGNPLSGLAAAPELLPQPWGAIGQYLPPGAGSSLIRSVGFFDGAKAMLPAIVLSAYSVVGLVLVVLGGRRRRPTPTDTAAESAARTAIAA
jgi:hypothetical protein